VINNRSYEEYENIVDSIDAVFRLIVKIFVHEGSTIQIISSGHHLMTVRLLSQLTVAVASERKMLMPASTLEEFNSKNNKKQFELRRSNFSIQLQVDLQHQY